MGLCKFIAVALAIQLVAANDSCSGLRLSTGLGALLGDLPLSSSLPCLPTLPSLESGCSSDVSLPSLASGDFSLPPFASDCSPDFSLPSLPPLVSGDCLPSLPLGPCESALAPLPAPCTQPGLRKRSFERKRRCGCKEPLLSADGCGLPSPPLLPPPFLPEPYLPPPCLPPPILEPYPLLRPKGGCLGECKDTLTTSLLEKLLLKKGLTLGLGPDCGPDVGLLPEAVSTFAADALAGPLAQGIGDCDCW